MRLKKPELMAPSGDWSSLHSAIESGADSVYFGVKDMNMRYGASNFDLLEIKKVMAFLHENKKRGYLTLNVLVYNNELARVRKILEAAKEAEVDAIILWDMAVFSIARELGLKVHLSTQASVSNIEALRHYASLGVERVVLARECDLPSIKDIIRNLREEKIACSIETFIHGAMCVSISGRCFLSNHSFGKSANRGECLQPCRREYLIKDKESECEYLLGEDYLLSAKDLCSLTFLDKLIEAGIDSFKIEGRIRSSEYVRVVTAVYRQAIDSFFAGTLSESLKARLLKKLKSVFNRDFSSGFYFGTPDDIGGIVEREYEKVYLGEVTKYFKKIGVARIEVKNGRIKTGDQILIAGKRTPANFARVGEMEMEHKAVVSAKKGEAVGIKLPFRAFPNDKVFLWIKD